MDWAETDGDMRDPGRGCDRAETASPVWLEAYDWLVLASGLVLFGVGGLFFTVVSAALYIVLPREKGIRAGRRSIHFLFRFFLWFLRSSGRVRCDLGELDRLRGAPPCVIAPNHISLLDAVFILSRVENVVCIMKAKIWDSPILGGGARLAGYIRNDSPGKMVRDAARELKQGTHLLVFPEGTRTANQPVGRFKGGFALIARLAGAPVQPVILTGSSRFLGKDWPLWKKPAFPLRYRARLGAPIRIAPDEDTKAAIERMERYFSVEVSRDAGAGDE